MATSPYCPHCGASNPSSEGACFACGHALAAPAPAAPGGQRLLRQRYRLLRQIGSGGFGAVYRAEDTQLGGRLVAIKRVSARGLAPEEAREATEGFLQEALLLARLSHPNLPHIYEHFEEAGSRYLVMEFIEGQTLEDYLVGRGGSLPVKEALQLALQLTGVLGYLHSRQPPVIFRDLKPGNVMVTPDGHIYLIDFGIARLFKPGQQRDTIAFGSPGYAAPEQYGKAQTTQRSDIFSLGALLHQMLTGVDPSDTPFRFKPLTMLRPTGLSTLIERMVDLDAEERPATMDVIRQDLENLLTDPAPWSADGSHLPAPGGSMPSARVTAAAAAYQAPAAPSRPSQQALPLSTTKRKRSVGKWLGWATAALVVLFACAALSQLNRTSDPGPVPGNTSGGTPVPAGASVPATLSWSPDGAYLAAGGDDSKIQVWNWDVVSDHLTAVWSTNLDETSALAWSPDSQYLAAAGNGGQVQIWQASGNPVIIYGFPPANINALAWSPDSKRLALGNAQGDGWVVDALSGAHSTRYQADGEPVMAIAWSPDGTSLAFGGGQTVQVWEYTTVRASYTYHDTQGVVNALAWAPRSGRIASADSDGQVQVWDAQTGTPFSTYRDTKDIVGINRMVNAITAIAWSPDGRYLASGEEDDHVQVWAAGVATPVYTYTQHTDSVNAVAWSHDGSRIASASADGTVQIWDAFTGSNEATYQQP